MAFKMKGFSGFGNPPVKQRKKYTKKDYDFLKEQREERVRSIDYLTKTPVGPRAKVKKKTIDFENPKDRDKVYNKTEIKRP